MAASMVACSSSAEYAIRPRMGQLLRMIWVVTWVRSTFSSWSLTQPAIRSLSVTSTVAVMLVISRTGSVTRSA